jgi:alanine racemase
MIARERPIPQAKEVHLMSIDYNRLRVRIDLGAILHNYRLLAARGSDCWPVVKADAYGHGLVEVAGALAGEGARTLCVGTPGEGAKLRDTGFAGRIVALLGPIDGAEARECVERGLVPLLVCDEQLALLREAAGSAGAEIGLKFDTGMGRLGFAPAEAGRLAGELAGGPLVPSMIVSHLAWADEPEGTKLVEEQARAFEGVRAAFSGLPRPAAVCLANSAAILRYPEHHFDAQRPGIMLYGGNPFHGTRWEELGADLRCAMRVSTRIQQVHDVEPGGCISYGCTFRASERMRVAVVSAGYADNWSRGLSNTGEVLVHGRRAPIVGRVCMQLTAVDVSAVPEAAMGDEAVLLGGEGGAAISPEELAGWWGTINYEVFCLLGMNPREYVGP